MTDFIIASLIDGLLLGFVYGVAAMGLTLIWGVMNVINLSHGPIITLGMFGVYLLFTNFGMNPYLALIPVAIVGLLFGILIFLVAVRRVIDAPHLSTLLATFAVAMIIIGLGTAALGAAPRNVDLYLGAFTFGPISIPISRIVAALASLLITAALYIFLRRTRTGRYIRAVSNNRAAAELVGVPSMRILAISFGIGTMLAAISGGLIASIFPFTVLAGSRYELKSFLIGVLGGLGNPVGALVGGLILGMLEGLIPVFMKTTWVPVIEFILFILILLVRPTGIFGARE